ncbi:MAG TPA: hypothetical protein VGM60_18375 [Pseudonocardia sp.]|jgi:hypothetical protein|uniref:hypothetical protein n=1 Tax=Pseudonocardia sp. TaxID=60912 RepID=UPI002F3F3B05
MSSEVMVDLGGGGPEAVAMSISGSGEVRAELAKRLRRAYGDHVGPGEQSVLVAWSSFTATFSGTRALTHWIRAGHGPSGGGMSVGGRHFHHYNIGIALLSAIGAVALRGAERHRKHPLTATAYGAANALIVDELMLLLDLRDVYWAKDGRTSVNAAIGLIGLGGVYLAAVPFWRRVALELTEVVSHRAPASSGL